MSETSQRRPGSRWIGWALLLLGLLVLMERLWGISWVWGLIGLGVLFLAAASRKRADTILLFPGTVFLITGAAILVRQLGLADFPLWLMWPIFFGSLGLAFLMLWIIRYSGWWVFIPGGILLFIAGVGMASRSWFLYQRWLYRVMDWWPILLLIVGIIIIIGYWRSRSEA